MVRGRRELPWLLLVLAVVAAGGAAARPSEPPPEPLPPRVRLTVDDLTLGMTYAEAPRILVAHHSQIDERLDVDTRYVIGGRHQVIWYRTLSPLGGERSTRATG